MNGETNITIASTIAWGNIRSAADWTSPLTEKLLFDRGFTGHEHLYDFGLINMNGRMYDPIMSSFLSVDNYVQSPENSQNFNRYAYCLNNPLKYTDPSGECIITSIIAGAFIGAIVNLAVADANGCLNTGVDFVNAASMGALTGAIGGAAGGAVGGAVVGLVGEGIGAGSGSIIGASAGFAGSFASASVGAWCTGASFGEGLLTGLKSGGLGALCGGVIGGLTGGYTAYKHGGNFWTGKGACFEFTSTGEITSKFEQKYYNNHIEDYENALNEGAEKLLNFKVGDVNVDLLTTKVESTDPVAIEKLKDYFINEQGFYGKKSGGEAYACTIKTSTFKHSEIHISPGVVDGYLGEYNIGHFHATLGHELTHAYHIYKGLPVSQTGPSEWAAKDYTKAIYDYYKMYNLTRNWTIPEYDAGWKVPDTYKFSRYLYP